VLKLFDAFVAALRSLWRVLFRGCTSTSTCQPFSSRTAPIEERVHLVWVTGLKRLCGSSEVGHHSQILKIKTGEYNADFKTW